MKNNSSTDLLAQKTDELEKLPGLLLGLDGWILRSIPHEYRRQFLTGYEKLLRVALHPDRYQREAQKLSRQAYLQAVSEAVDYMTRDEFNFELAADAVPTKRNPFVALKESVEVRENIISSLSDTLEDTRNTVSKLTQSEHAVRSQISGVIDRTDRELDCQYRLQRAMNELVKSFPVPLACPQHSVTGGFVNLCAKGNTDLIDNLTRYSTGNLDCGRSIWFTQNEYIASFEPCLVSPARFQFKRRTSHQGDYSIIGAMTLPHLCEFIRSQRQRMNPQKPSDQQMTESLAKLLAVSMSEAEIQNEWRVDVGPFLVPFYTTGSLLLLRKLKSAGEMGLFLVKMSDYAQSPNQAIINGFKQEIVGYTLQVSQLRREIKETRHRVSVLREQLRRKSKLKLGVDNSGEIAQTAVSNLRKGKICQSVSCSGSL